MPRDFYGAGLASLAGAPTTAAPLGKIAGRIGGLT